MTSSGGTGQGPCEPEGDVQERYLELVGEGRWSEAEDLLDSLPAAERGEVRALSEGLLASLGPAETALLFRPGACLGDLVLVRELGRGGMGMVWEAEQPAIGRRVAVKLLYPVYALFDRHQRRFRREARAAARLRHPNVAAVYDLGEVHATPYIVQELVPGGRSLLDELADLAAAQGPLPARGRGLPVLPPGHARRMARLFLQVAEALEHAHACGVLHRDLKPANLLLLEGDRIKVVDFGLACVLDDASVTRAGEASGTPLYMAPELSGGAGRPPDGRVDIYALGVSLLEALSLPGGLAPGDLESWRAALRAGRPLDPRHLRAGVPRDLAALALAAAEPRPERRPAGAAAVAEELRRFLAGEPVRCRPSYRRRRALWYLRRARLPLAAAGLASLAVAGILLFSERGKPRPFTSPTVAEQHLAVAQGHARQGRLATAGTLLREARFAWRGDAAGAPLAHLVAAELLLLLRMGDETRAEELLESHPGLIQIGEALAREQAGDPDPYVRHLSGVHLGLLALLAEEPQRAALELSGGLGSASASFGEHHALTLELRRWHAEALFRMAEYKDAHLEFLALHACQRELRGEADVATFLALADVGRTSMVRDDIAQAIESLQPAWPRLADALGREHGETLRAGLALARARMRGEDLAAARAILEQLERDVRLGGVSGSRTLLEVRAELAGIMELERDFAAAEALHRRILADHRQHRGADHPTAVHARVSWALAFARTPGTPPEEARQALLGAARNLGETLGPREPRARFDAHRLARELGRLLGAEAAVQELSALPGLAEDSRFLLANALIGADRGQEARLAIDSIWKTQLAESGGGAASAVVRRTVAECLRSAGNYTNARSYLSRARYDTPPGWTGERIDQLAQFPILDRAIAGAGYKSPYGW